MDISALLVFLLIGALAGWLGGVITKGGGYGLLGDIVIGVLGAGYVRPLRGYEIPTYPVTIISDRYGVQVDPYKYKVTQWHAQPAYLLLSRLLPPGRVCSCVSRTPRSVE